MTIFLNGERTECGAARTMEELVQQHGLAPETTLIEHNGVALRRRDWPNEKLEEGDRIEVLLVSAGG